MLFMLNLVPLAICLFAVIKVISLVLYAIDLDLASMWEFLYTNSNSGGPDGSSGGDGGNNNDPNGPNNNPHEAPSPMRDNDNNDGSGDESVNSRPDTFLPEVTWYESEFYKKGEFNEEVLHEKTCGMNEEQVEDWTNPHLQKMDDQAKKK